MSKLVFYKEDITRVKQDMYGGYTDVIYSRSNSDLAFV